MHDPAMWSAALHSRLHDEERGGGWRRAVAEAAAARYAWVGAPHDGTGRA